MTAISSASGSGGQAEEACSATRSPIGIDVGSPHINTIVHTRLKHTHTSSSTIIHKLLRSRLVLKSHTLRRRRRRPLRTRARALSPCACKVNYMIGVRARRHVTQFVCRDAMPFCAIAALFYCSVVSRKDSAGTHARTHACGFSEMPAGWRLDRPPRPNVHEIIIPT